MHIFVGAAARMRQLLTSPEAVSTLALLLLAGCGGPPGPAPIAFRFAPPEGVEWARTEHHTRLAEVPGFGRSQFLGSVRSVVRVERASAWTLAWTERLESFDLTVDGRNPFPDLSRAVAGLEVVTEVMEDGEVTAVRGAERIEALIAQHAAAQGLDDGAVPGGAWAHRESERAAWRERVQSLAGKSLGLGESVELAAAQDLGGGRELTHRVRLTPRALEPCGASECVKVEVAYASDPAEVERYLGSPLSALLPDSELAGAEVTLLAIEVSGGGERLVEPATLLVRKEKLEKKVRLTLRAPGRDLEVLFTIIDRGELHPKA